MAEDESFDLEGTIREVSQEHRKEGRATLHVVIEDSDGILYCTYKVGNYANISPLKGTLARHKNIKVRVRVANDSEDAGKEIFKVLSQYQIVREQVELSGTVDSAITTHGFIGNNNAHILNVLIRHSDGTLYNTIMKSKNTDYIEQLRSTLQHKGTHVNVKVELDLEETREANMNVYQAISQYKIPKPI